MFKVTEILKDSQGRRSYMNYVRDGGVGDAVTSVGQILGHRINSIEDLVQCSGLIIEITFENAVYKEETFATGMLVSDREVLAGVMDFICQADDARWAGQPYKYRKLVLEF